MVLQVQAINEVSALSPFPPQFASINFTTSQSGTRKSNVCWMIHSVCVHQTVCSVYQCLSVPVTMSILPPPVFPLPLPTVCLSIHLSLSLSSVHHFSSSALWTQVALGHDMLSFHIMVKKATRETERDEEWREDNQCGSPQKLWKQNAQFRCLSLSLSLSLSCIFSSNSSSDGFCRPVYDSFT